jgi:hypothetical protein
MVGSVDGRVVECSSVVANRATDRAITIPNPNRRTSTPPVGDAERSRTDPQLKTPHLKTAVQKNAIKNTTSNTSLARRANAADQNADRPQRAGAGVAEWG